MLVIPRQLRTATKPYNMSSWGSRLMSYFPKFPIKGILKMIRKPNYGKIKNMVHNLYKNTLTLPTTLGGARHRHIELIMRPELYAKLSQTLYTTPIDPGYTSVIPTKITAVE